MNRYIRIKGYDFWFMVIESERDIPADFNDLMNHRLQKQVGSELMSNKVKDWHVRFSFVANNPIDYAAMLRKYNSPLLVRPNGSWMLLSDGFNDIKIEKTVYGQAFPTENSKFNAVICENGSEAEQFWIDYLNQMPVHGAIEVLNFFGTRSEQEISKIFAKTTFVTFSTTFTDLDWFKKVVRCLHPHNVLIGYSHCGWEGTDEILKGQKIRKVEKNDLTCPHHCNVGEFLDSN